MEINTETSLSNNVETIERVGFYARSHGEHLYSGISNVLPIDIVMNYRDDSFSWEDERRGGDRSMQNPGNTAWTGNSSTVVE